MVGSFSVKIRYQIDIIISREGCAPAAHPDEQAAIIQLKTMHWIDYPERL
jgi:hypothetical protein